MIDGICLANTQWQSGTQDALVNWPFLEDMERRCHMPINRTIWAPEIKKAEENLAWAKEHPGEDTEACGDWMICLEPEDFLDLIAGKWDVT